MKTLLIALALTTPCYGQLRGLQRGSAEAVMAAARNQREAAERQARLKKEKEAGKALFGVDNRWPFPEGPINRKNDPREFQIGDWGCTSVTMEFLSKVSPNEFLVMPDYVDRASYSSVGWTLRRSRMRPSSSSSIPWSSRRPTPIQRSLVVRTQYSSSK